MHFPLFIELEGRHCLVVGGGKVAARKVAILRSFGAAVTVVAPRVDAEIADAKNCTVEHRPFRDSDVKRKVLVVAATNDAALNAHVADLCRACEVPVNVVDDPLHCTFVFPAICQRGPMVAAVSSGGASPVAAKLVRDKLARLMPDDFITAVEALGARREELKREYPDPQDRKRHCEEALSKWKD